MPDAFLPLMIGVVGTAVLWWFFFGPRGPGVAAQVMGERQEIEMRVNRGYSPDRIVARAHLPIRLKILREETDPCSEQLIFEGLGLSTELPPFRWHTLDLPALDPGVYPFACGMAMLHGTLVVE